MRTSIWAGFKFARYLPAVAKSVSSACAMALRSLWQASKCAHSAAQAGIEVAVVGLNALAPSMA